MAWTVDGDAVTLANGSSPHTTSTSTILVENSYLRMFFVRAELEFPDLIPVDAPPLLDGGLNALGYVDSDSAFEFSAVTDLYLTVVPTDKEAVSRYFPDGSLRSYTNVRYQDPHVLELPRGMGYLLLLAEYLSGIHWGRQEDIAATAEDESQVTISPLRTNCASAIVAYLSSEPGFGEGSVQGPVWVVGRSQPWPDPDSGDTALAWLGVPAGCVLTVDDVEYLYVYYVVELSEFEDDAEENGSLNAEEHDGVYVRRLLLHHVVEALGGAWVPADDTTEEDAASAEWGEASTTVEDEEIDWNRIRYDLDTIQGAAALAGSAARSYSAQRALDWSALGGAKELPETWIDHPSVRDGSVGHGSPSVPEAEGGGYFELSPLDWTDEAAWDLSTDSHLLPGEDLGKVRVWVATGSEFHEDWDPTNDQGNTEFEDYYANIQIVDPVPVASGGQLVLYFSANTAGGGSSSAAPIGYGAWCAVAAAKTILAPYGLHFAVYPVDLETDIGDRNMVAAGSIDASGTMDSGYLDPDPVQLPGGAWVVAVGHVSGGTSPSVDQLTRVEGDTADGLPSTGDPWS